MSQLLASDTNLSTQKKMYGNLVNIKIVASDIFSGKTTIDLINGIWKCS